MTAGFQTTKSSIGRLKHAIATLLGSVLILTLSHGTLEASGAGSFLIVSVGDSVASGEGVPNAPQRFSLNPDFNPVPFQPNPSFDPTPFVENPNFDPNPGVINQNYDPREFLINPNFQPFPAPTGALKAALDAIGFTLPPQNTTLFVDNPNFNTTLLNANPSFNPSPVIDNPNINLTPWSDTPNPDFNPEPWLITDAEWESEDDHRSVWAGPARAANELIRQNPEAGARFRHYAESGANIEAVGNQIEQALSENNDRIDLLMISAGGNDLHEDGFSGLLSEVLDTIFVDLQRPSRDPALNRLIERNIAAMADSFDALALKIAAGNVGEVFITEYFDITQDEEGFSTFPEADWIYDRIIVPLNETIAAAATRHGWHYVGGIAAAFAGHGFLRDGQLDPVDPLIVNPDYNPIQSYPNPNYDPLREKFNFNYNPIRELPNPNYNPIQDYPNLNWNPIPTVPKSGLAGLCFPLPECSDPNPNYNPNLTVRNSDYNPNLTVSNPSFDNRLTIPNQAFDNRFMIPNPDYSPDLTTSNPNFQELWTNAINIGSPLPATGPNQTFIVHLEESLAIQGDVYGTAHPNYWGQQVYRDALLNTIRSVMPTLEPQSSGNDIPVITRIEGQGRLRIFFEASGSLDQLYLYWSSDLETWAESSADIRFTPSGESYISTTIDGAPQRFFRIGCR